MIANFQTREVAKRYHDQLRAMGYLFASIVPYRGGFQVFTTGIRWICESEPKPGHWWIVTP